MSKGRGDFLPATTTAAIDFLESRSDDEKGFFLMVEGARIDKSSHDNDFPSMVKEVLDFDKAVEAAIRFAEKDGRTLVIISADHETGALSLRSGDPAEGKMKGAFSSGGHTAIPVPLFAYGPCSRNFMGVQENSDVSSKIEEILLNR
jgi:alkaline phosphatase